jgi:hypothetical protein
MDTADWSKASVKSIMDTADWSKASVKSIMERADWSKESTFTRFYLCHVDVEALKSV